MASVTACEASSLASPTCGGARLSTANAGNCGRCGRTGRGRHGSEIVHTLGDHRGQETDFEFGRSAALGCTQLKPLDYGSWIDAAGRLLLVGFFVVAGLCNLTREQIKSHIDYMGEAGTPFPAAAFWIGIVLQFTGCALIIAGWHPEVGVYCLIVFILAATAIFHRFWSMTDPMRRNLARLFLLNNIAILAASCCS